MGSTRTSRRIAASRADVYRALLDADAVARWRAPDGMTATVHELDPCQGGRFRISLTYDGPTERGKTTAHTDTYHGHFALAVPDEQIVEVLEFETTNPDFGGTLTVITTLADVEGGTEITIQHEGLPPGVSSADNETGTQMALAKLAALLGRA